MLSILKKQYKHYILIIISMLLVFNMIPFIYWICIFFSLIAHHTIQFYENEKKIEKTYLINNLTTYLCILIFSFRNWGYVGLTNQLLSIALHEMLLNFIPPNNKKIFFNSFFGLVGIISYFLVSNYFIKSIMIGFIFLWSSSLLNQLLDKDNKFNFQFFIHPYSSIWILFGILPINKIRLENHFMYEIESRLKSIFFGLKIIILLFVIYWLQIIFLNKIGIYNHEKQHILLFKSSFNGEIALIIDQWVATFNLSKSLMLVFKIIVNSVFSISKIVSLYGLCIALANLYGFNLKLFPYSFMQINSSVKIYSSILYYYSRMIFDLFYKPLIILYKVRYDYQKKLILFIALFFGSIVSHFIINLRSINYFKNFEQLIYKTEYFIYYTIVLCIVLSVFPKFIFFNKENNKLKNIFNMIYSFSLYSLVILANEYFYKFENNLFTYLKNLISLI